MKRLLTLVILGLLVMSPIIVRGYTYVGSIEVGTYYDGAYNGIDESVRTFWVSDREVTFEGAYPYIVVNIGSGYVVIANANQNQQLIQLNDSLTPTYVLNISGGYGGVHGYYTTSLLPFARAVSSCIEL